MNTNLVNVDGNGQFTFDIYWYLSFGKVFYDGKMIAGRFKQLMFIL